MKHFKEDRTEDRFGVISQNVPHVKQEEDDDGDYDDVTYGRDGSKLIRSGPTYVEIDEFGNTM